jgi:hypothetical protein
VLLAAAGYFFWDTIDAILWYKQSGIAFILHGIVCLGLYSYSYAVRGLYPLSDSQANLVQYYGLLYLCFELSTPFGNLAWFFRFLPIKVPDFIVTLNKMIFAAVFVGVRLICGVFWTYQFFGNCLAYLRVQSENQAPNYYEQLAALTFFLMGNLILTALNFFWFAKILFWVQK